MPNYVWNNVSVIGSKATITRFKNAVKGEDRDFDFNKVIPMPKDLDIESCRFKGKDEIDLAIFKSCLPLALKKKKISQADYVAEKAKYITEHQNTFGLTDILKDKNGERYLRLSLQYFYNKVKYGFEDWYEWCIEYWDTKWNSIEIVSDEGIKWDGDKISFLTAWGTPDNIYRTLSQRFPSLTIKVEFCDEDMYGTNLGVMTYKNGLASLHDVVLDEVRENTWGIPDKEAI